MARALQGQYIDIVRGFEDVVFRYDANLKAIAKILTWGVRAYARFCDVPTRTQRVHTRS